KPLNRLQIYKKFISSDLFKGLRRYRYVYLDVRHNQIICMNTSLILWLVSFSGLTGWIIFLHHSGTKVLRKFPSKKPNNFIYSERKVEATNLAKMKRHNGSGRLIIIDLYFTDTEIWFTSHWFSAMAINKLDLIQRVTYEEVLSFQQEKSEIEITINNSKTKRLKILIVPNDRKRVIELLNEKCAKQQISSQHFNKVFK
uniref:hypothetical protein n=1 Tax=Crocinitomix catalasitica TaxID=184607 RepID=UPI00055C8D47